jgi:thimet oligopeptidase
MKRFIFWIGALSLAIVGCTDDKAEPQLQVDDTYSLRFDHSPAAVTDLCTAEQKRLKDTLDAISKIPAAQANFANTVAKLESATTEFGNTINPVSFLKYVSAKEDVRTAADACETEVSQFYVDLFTRPDLYAAIKAAAAKGEALDADSDQLLKEYLIGFKRNGLELNEAGRKLYIEKKKALVKLEAEFGTNLNEYQDELIVTQAELDGLPESYVRGLKRTDDGKYKVGLSYPHYYPFMENAKNADARKRLEFKFNRRGGEKNRDLLRKAIQIRQELATLLGYKNHAEFVLERQMAKKPEEVTEKFLKPLIAKLQIKGEADRAEMLEAKRKELNDPTASEITAWDWRYYGNQIKKEKHQIDNQKVREYFPLDVVTKGMFEIYQTMLSVKFEPVSQATWFDGVQLYRIVDGDRTVAYFFMDLFPREGKYGHAAAFTLVSGYLKSDGKYRAPVSSIVANFNPPADGQPSLLEHSEVETLFHEFGHIMHQTLTKARFASFSGTNVNRDFVEAPSQMLENWVWEPQALAKMSGHYLDKSKSLPEELVQKMVKAKLHNSGVTYLRQASFATLDMEYHTLAPTDSTEVYARAMRDVMGIPIQEGTYPEASFGHLMGGYDAGYYGYLWSEVFAADMYTKFSQRGLLDPVTGSEYRTWILEKGGTLDPFKLITNFLGREPNNDAFLKSLGL